VKVNPHAPEKVNIMVSSEYQFFNAGSQNQLVREVLLGGKLNAYLSLRGQLSV